MNAKRLGLTLFGLVGWALVLQLWPSMSPKDHAVGAALLIAPVAAVVVVYVVGFFTRRH